MGKVLTVAEVEGLTQHGDRFALEGHPLAAGHPLHDAYIGRPDPLANQSQNSVTYGSLPEEGPLLIRPCACGCGQETARDFAQGHDMKAVQQRVREHFGGSAPGPYPVDRQCPPSPRELSGPGREEFRPQAGPGGYQGWPGGGG